MNDMYKRNLFRYNCNRYDEKEAQAARDAQAVSFNIIFIMLSPLIFIDVHCIRGLVASLLKAVWYNQPNDSSNFKGNM